MSLLYTCVCHGGKSGFTKVSGCERRQTLNPHVQFGMPSHQKIRETRPKSQNDVYRMYAPSHQTNFQPQLQHCLKTNWRQQKRSSCIMLLLAFSPCCPQICHFHHIPDNSHSLTHDSHYAFFTHLMCECQYFRNVLWCEYVCQGG